MLQRAITSVLEQTHPVSHMSVFTDWERKGAPYARQKALEGNVAPWTAFLDSDDWFMKHHIATLAKAQLETGADYVYSWFELVRFNQKLGSLDTVFPETHFSQPWDPANPRQTTITILVRTDLAREVGFWDPGDDQEFEDGHRVGEDYMFTEKCNELGKIHHVVERTWYWHHHGLNTSGRATQGDAKR